MAVKILIKRRLKEGHFDRAADMIIQARSNALGKQGHISSETLRSLDDPNEVVIISMWETESDWKRFKDSPGRNELEAVFSQYLDGPTRYQAYGVGLGRK